MIGPACFEQAPSAPVGQASGTVATSNGVLINGVLINGVLINGFAINDNPAFALELNGIGSAGGGLTGARLDATGLDGLYINTLGENGVGDDGQGTSEVGSTGVGTSGIVMSGVLINGLDPELVGSDGLGVEGASLDGWAMNGLYVNGVLINGVFSKGVSIDGVSMNGVALTQAGLDQLEINGTGSNAVQIYGAGASGEIEVMDLDAGQEDNFKTVLYHLAACALNAGDSIIVRDSSGAAMVYEGSRGLAPEWKTGPLSREGSERVRACLSSSPAASFGVALNADQEQRLMKLMRYLVECALPEGSHVVMYRGDGSAHTLSGALGLAPEWQTGPLNSAGQRRVSACLAARSNALEQPVNISLRGAGIVASPVERNLYKHHEGVFWGNLFADDSHLSSCVARGGGLSGRVCAQGTDCGMDFVGDCADVCGARDPSDGSYLDCGGETEVINTYLNLGQQLEVGETDDSCLIDDDGALWCWGRNNFGQVGDGSTTNRAAPTPVIGPVMDVSETRLGADHTCARYADGSLWCWGRNREGQLGLGVNQNQSWPTHVSALGHDVTSFATGENHTCALLTNGRVYCWGANDRGQVGVGSYNREFGSPQHVFTFNNNDVAKVVSGAWAVTTCAIQNDGTWWCWGDNNAGQLGIGSYEPAYVPQHVVVDESGAPFGSVTDACVTIYHTCMRRSDGTLWCAGGDKSTRPHEVAFGSRVAPGGLSCGAEHVCVVTDDSAVWCMGKNNHEQLGYPTSGNHTWEDMQRVPSMLGVVLVSAGRTHTCAKKFDGTRWCWGTDASHMFPVPLSIEPVLITWNL